MPSLSPLVAMAYAYLIPPVAPFGTAPLPDQWVQVPMVFPLVGGGAWRDTYNQLRGHYRHTGEDIKAPKMTPIVAPFSGRIGFKRESFWIYGDNGWRCLGTHLNDDTPGTGDNQGGMDTMFAPNLEQGGPIRQGQLIGYVGDSGNATGPHLHFEIYGSGGIRNPRPSLKMAQKLSRPTAVVESPEDVPADGQERWDVCLREVQDDSFMIKAILVSRQLPGGPAMAEASPTLAWVKVKDTAMMGGPSWAELKALPSYRTVRLYVVRRPEGIFVERLAVSQPFDQTVETR